MKRIAFVSVPGWPGHFLQSLALAKALVRRGHAVDYIVPPDYAALVVRHGVQPLVFQPVPLLTPLPRRQAASLVRLLDEHSSAFGQFLGSRGIGLLIHDFHVWPVGALAAWRKIPTIQFWPHLPYFYRFDCAPLGTGCRPDRWSGRINSGLSWAGQWLAARLARGWTATELLYGARAVHAAFRRFCKRNHWSGGPVWTGNDMYFGARLGGPNIIAMNSAFTFTGLPTRGVAGQGCSFAFVGDAVDESRAEDPAVVEALGPLLDDPKPLIYCSMSSGQLTRTARKINERLVRMMRSSPHLNALIATGAPPKNRPDNLKVVPVAPQLTILRKAAVAIIHGGAGAVRECIRFGVPMLVFPLKWDQPGNAARVEYHHLGLVGKLSRFQDQVQTLLTESSFRDSLRWMGAQAREEWNRGEALLAIEQALEQHPDRMRSPGEFHG